MKEFIEKLNGRLEEKRKTAFKTYTDFGMNTDLGRMFGFKKAIDVVNQLAEEYNNESVKGDLISRSAVIELIESKCVDGCLEQDDITLIDAYGLMDDVSDLPTAYNDGWIPCSERLPEVGQIVFIQVTCEYQLEMGDETPIQIRKYEPKHNGFDWKQIGFGEWLRSDLVLAWQPLPREYIPKGAK